MWQLKNSFYLSSIMFVYGLFVGVSFATDVRPSWEQIKQQAKRIEFVDEAGVVYGLPILITDADIDLFASLKNSSKDIVINEKNKKISVKRNQINAKDLNNLLAFLHGKDVDEFELVSLVQMAVLANTLGLNDQSLIRPILDKIKINASPELAFSVTGLVGDLALDLDDLSLEQVKKIVWLGSSDTLRISFNDGHYIELQNLNKENRSVIKLRSLADGTKIIQNCFAIYKFNILNPAQKILVQYVLNQFIQSSMRVALDVAALDLLGESVVAKLRHIGCLAPLEAFDLVALLIADNKRLKDFEAQLN